LVIADCRDWRTVDFRLGLPISNQQWRQFSNQQWRQSAISNGVNQQSEIRSSQQFI
jgi:hypothetical protein